MPSWDNPGRHCSAWISTSKPARVAVTASLPGRQGRETGIAKLGFEDSNAAVVVAPGAEGQSDVRAEPDTGVTLRCRLNVVTVQIGMERSTSVRLRAGSIQRGFVLRCCHREWRRKCRDEGQRRCWDRDLRRHHRYRESLDEPDSRKVQPRRKDRHSSRVAAGMIFFVVKGQATTTGSVFQRATYREPVDMHITSESVEGVYTTSWSHCRWTSGRVREATIPSRSGSISTGAI